ncbi:MAG: class I SAM-dependent methyltransferase [Bacteroidales bacterium]|nr:class I SAM-dependent methyltransferase [Bacteroidales bacterium]
MENWFTELLRDPVSLDVLECGEGLLTNAVTKQSYPVRQQIPVFTEGGEAKVTTDLHARLNSRFDYIDHYEKDAEVFDYCSPHVSASANVEEAILRKMIVRNVPKAATLLLDTGCGSAWFADHFVAKGKKVVSLDVSFTNVSKAMTAIPSPDHAAVVADVFRLPFGANTFDCIVASEIMEHLYDPELFVKKLFYILKPGGTLILTTPYNEKLEYNLCVHCNKPTPRNAHLHSFNEKNIKELLKTVAEKEVKIKRFNNALLMKLRLHLLFGNTFLWRALDSITNKMFKKAMRLMVVLTK